MIGNNHIRPGALDAGELWLAVETAPTKRAKSAFADSFGSRVSLRRSQIPFRVQASQLLLRLQSPDRSLWKIPYYFFIHPTASFA